MKRLILYIAALLALTACEEQNNLINLRPGGELIIDSTYEAGSLPSPQPHNVIIEEMTGVQCPNCPNAQEEAQEISELYPGRINLISYHVTKKFASPIPGLSKQSFMTDAGTDILNYLGTPPSLPIGTVDRMVFDGNTSRLINFNVWKSYVAQRLSVQNKVNIQIENGRQLADGSYEAYIKVTFLQDINRPVAVTAAISESNIIDAQELPTSGFDTNYVHHHVLRNIINPISGLKLADQVKKGQVFSLYFSTKLEPHWVVDNCHLLALVHIKDGEELEVLQSVESHLIK